jgi:hypothetical protein
VSSSSLPTTAVVGAGPSGLALARAFLADGLPIEVFERHGDVGGIWDPENEGSPIYESAHYISSRTMSAYPDFPMPDRFPDYPSHRQILQYLRSFADRYGLRSVITTGCGVDHADWDGEQWHLSLSTGEQKRFDHLVCANGTQWDPVMPDIPGQFDGTLMHSNEHWSAEAFRGKRVLVIGAGNSGVDIACDAAQTASHAVLSMRRGYHVVPKHIFGQPADVFADTGPELPVRVSQFIFGKLLRLLHGDPTRLGLPKPDHRLFETHPIVNTEILHFLSHGDLAIATDVTRFDGETVYFADGTSDDFDIVVCATGYRTSVPYLDPSHFEWRHERPQLYLHAFHRSNPHLHALGFTEGDGGACTVFDNTAVAIAGVVRMLHERPERTNEWLELVATDPVEFRGGVKHIDTPRHANYLHIKDYLKHLKKLTERFGWEPADPDRYISLRSPVRVRG